MKILAVDTTTDIASLALASESGLLADYNFQHHMDLSRRLLPNITGLLRDCGMELKDLEGLAVSIGPGSFTGLRIGAVTIKTIAQVLDIPAVGIVSLDILARGVSPITSAVICPMVKVHRGEVYYALYQATKNGVERTTDYAAEPAEKLAERLALLPIEPVLLCGDGMREHYDSFRQSLGERITAVPQWLAYPRAQVLAEMAFERLASGEGRYPAVLLPFYIRKSAPEMKLECASE
jgi:tRNA threonylcarbamoyladenosine biosynthesis protein TsaB